VRPYTYSEGENEAPKLVEEEPVDVERDAPETENEPLEREDRQDQPNPPIFEE
jgi:hypothetical protein